MPFEFKTIKHAELRDLVAETASLDAKLTHRMLVALYRVLFENLIEGHTIHLRGIGDLEMEVRASKRVRFHRPEHPSPLIKFLLVMPRNLKRVAKQESKLLRVIASYLKTHPDFNPRDMRWWTLPEEEAEEVFVTRRMRAGSARKDAKKQWNRRKAHIVPADPDALTNLEFSLEDPAA